MYDVVTVEHTKAGYRITMADEVRDPNVKLSDYIAPDVVGVYVQDVATGEVVAEEWGTVEHRHDFFFRKRSK